MTTPRIELRNVDLEAFERSVYARRHEEAGRLLFDALRQLKVGASYIHYEPYPEMMKILHTRFAAAIVSLFADPLFELGQVGFDMLSSEHATLDLLFRSSAFGTSDHMLTILSARVEGDEMLKLPQGATLVKFLLIYSLRSGFKMNFERVFSGHPQQSLGLWMGMMATLHRIGPIEFRRYEELLGFAGLFADCAVTDEMMSGLAEAYMQCSYAVRPDKHSIKATLNSIFRRALLATGAEEIDVHERLLESSAAMLDARYAAGFDGKPTMVVGIDWFTSIHAMYRCWAPVIRQLRKQFYLIGMSSPDTIDEQGKKEFDEWHAVPQGTPLIELTKQVKAFEPDLIFYPSIGMSVWWISLSTLRLAPLQIVSLGHPATTMSPVIDYVLCEEGQFVQNAFSEEPLIFPAGAARFIKRADFYMPELRVAPDVPDTINVAVPAMLMKLNAPYIATLKEAFERSERPIRYHFFCNTEGICLFQAAADIRKVLPDALIYQRTSDYKQYMDELNKCDFAVCTFPFGGTNSTLDALHVGLPVVTWKGPQPHERYDWLMLRKCGGPQHTCTTADEFASMIVNLANDDAFRNQWRAQVRDLDLDAIFYGGEERTEIVDIVMKKWKERCSLSLT